MRYVIALSILVVLAPGAIAQTAQGNTGDMNNMPNRATMPPAGGMASQPGAENCGTPEEPKSCPPLPRHSLPNYPANKQ
jgi:hypothetical protein